MQSFVSKGFREGFKLANFGDRHTCETCGQVFVLKEMKDREPGVVGPNEFVVSDKDSVIHYTWQPVTH